MKTTNYRSGTYSGRTAFCWDLRGIVRSNLQKVYSAINFGQVNTNWNIGRRIVEEENMDKRVLNMESVWLPSLRKRWLKSLEKDIHKLLQKLQKVLYWVSEISNWADTICPIREWIGVTTLVTLRAIDASDW